MSETKILITVVAGAVSITDAIFNNNLLINNN